MRLRKGTQEFVDAGPAEAFPDWSDKPFFRHLSSMPYEQARKEHERLGALARKYGITPEDVSELETKHGGLCALCGRSGKLHIDHDHRTGRVRALLCARCNMLLGHYEKDPAAFVALIDRFPGYVG